MSIQTQSYQEAFAPRRKLDEDVLFNMKQNSSTPLGAWHVKSEPATSHALSRTEHAIDLSDLPEHVMKSLRRGELESEAETDSSSLTSSSGELSVGDISESSSEDVMHDTEGKRKVCFCEEVNVREFTSSDPSDSEGANFVMRLKRGDFSRPVIEAVKFSPEEEAIRSKLVGCIRAEKRIRPDFGRMYGCGKRLRTDDYDGEDYDSYDEDEEEEEDEDLAQRPIRTIQAHAPSACWFTSLF